MPRKHAHVCAHTLSITSGDASWPALSSKSLDLILLSPRVQEFYFWNSSTIMIAHTGRRPPSCPPALSCPLHLQQALLQATHTWNRRRDASTLDTDTGTRTPSPPLSVGNWALLLLCLLPSPSHPHSPSGYLPELRQTGVGPLI